MRRFLIRAATRNAALSTAIGSLVVMRNRLRSPRRAPGLVTDTWAPRGFAPAESSGFRILVVDPNLPVYDKMSGSLRLFRLLGLLREAGHHVTFLARKAGQQEPYRSQLEAMGIVVHAGDPERLRQRGMAGFGRPLDLAALLRNGRFDVAWLDFFELAEQYLPEIRAYAPSTRILVDTIDVHWVRQQRQADIEGDASGRLHAQTTRLREEKVYRAADGLIAVTADDAWTLREMAPDVPTYVLGNVHPLEESGSGHDSRSGVVFVGNFNHPPNVDAVLYLMREVMPLVWATRPAMGVTIVGTDPPPVVRELAGGPVTVTGHVPDTRPYLEAARVSVAPLRFGAGMKGKIGEAIAVGLPVVTTPIGAEGMGLEDGVHVLIADSAAGLAESIKRLDDDAELWSRLSEGGRWEVERRYGVDATRVRLADLLDKATCVSARTPTPQLGTGP